MPFAARAFRDCRGKLTSARAACSLPSNLARRSPSQYDKGVFRSILCQGVLTQHALCARKQVADGTCPFCKRAPETLFHLYWECPAWHTTRSAFTVPEVEEVRGWEPCARLCGIFLLPPSVVAFEASLRAEIFSLPEVTFPLTESERLSVWVDGSAVDHLDHRITRTGSGIFFACDSPCNLSFPILGPVQTAFRAELAALAAVLCSADRPLRVHSDCQDVVDHFNHFAHEGFLDCPGTDIWLLLLPIIRSRPPGFFQVFKVKGHASTTDVDKGLVSVPDKIGNDGAHALALAAAQARRFPFSDRSALQEHDALAFEVHRCMTAVVVARNKESERLGIYAPRRRLDTGGGSDAEDTGNDAPCDSSSVPARFAITKSADQARRLQRKAVQNALAGVERPTHDSDGLPLNEAGRFLHVVYRKSGTFGARITLRGKTTNLGVYPTARDAAVAVQAFKRTGKVERLSKSEAASVAAVRVLHRRVEAHNTTAKTNGKHMFSVSARLLSCNACAAEFTSHDFARACSLICPRLGPPAGFLVDKRGSHTRANTLSATRQNVFVEHVRAHNTQARRRGLHVLDLSDGALARPRCTVCNQSVARSYARTWMRRPCPGPG